MSDEFCLPVAVSVSQHRWLNAALIGVHALPLLVLTVLWVGWGVGADVGEISGAVGVGLSVLVAFSLGFELHRQRRARGASRLAGDVEDGWLLHRRETAPSRVEVMDQLDLSVVLLLLLRQDGRKFRLLVVARAQPPEQLHRLRILLKSRARSRRA